VPEKPADLSEEQVRAIIAGSQFPESRDYPPSSLPRPDDLTAEDVRALSEGTAAAELLQLLIPQ